MRGAVIKPREREYKPLFEKEKPYAIYKPRGNLIVFLLIFIVPIMHLLHQIYSVNEHFLNEYIDGMQHIQYIEQTQSIKKWIF